jgi:hypothetical protein
MDFVLKARSQQYRKRLMEEHTHFVGSAKANPRNDQERDGSGVEIIRKCMGGTGFSSLWVDRIILCAIFGAGVRK